jgi:hypothetical protein
LPGSNVFLDRLEKYFWGALGGKWGPKKEQKKKKKKKKKQTIIYFLRLPKAPHRCAICNDPGKGKRSNRLKGA